MFIKWVKLKGQLPLLINIFIVIIFIYLFNRSHQKVAYRQWEKQRDTHDLCLWVWTRVPWRLIVIVTWNKLPLIHDLLRWKGVCTFEWGGTKWAFPHLYYSSSHCLLNNENAVANLTCLLTVLQIFDLIIVAKGCRTRKWLFSMTLIVWLERSFINCQNIQARATNVDKQVLSRYLLWIPYLYRLSTLLSSISKQMNNHFD